MGDDADGRIDGRKTGAGTRSPNVATIKDGEQSSDEYERNAN